MGAGLEAGAAVTGSADDAEGWTVAVRAAMAGAGGEGHADEGTEDPDGVEEAVALGARQPPKPNHVAAASSANRTTRAITPACEGGRAEEAHAPPPRFAGSSATSARRARSSPRPAMCS
jgi:hypothetical protein